VRPAGLEPATLGLEGTLSVIAGGHIPPDFSGQMATFAKPNTDLFACTTPRSR